MKRIAWYPGWRRGAIDELYEKNARLEFDFKIGEWERYDYDIARGMLTFSERGVARVVARIQVVGSTDPKAGNWLWSWGNPHFPRESVADAGLVRAFGHDNGIAELTQGYVESGDLDVLGWDLTAVMVRVTNAIGAYRPPSKAGGALFVTCKSVAWAT